MVTAREMTMTMVHMANHLNASTDQETLNYVLLGRPHRERMHDGVGHPTYLEMIKGAVQTLNNGRGSSKAAILKYIAQNYHVGENLPKVNMHLHRVLKKAVEAGQLEQAKGHEDEPESFRLGREFSKSMQVGIPVQTPSLILLSEVKRKLSVDEDLFEHDTVEQEPELEKVTKKVGKMMKSKRGPPMQRKKKATMPKKGLKNKRGKSGTKAGVEMKKIKIPPAPTTMELRTGTRKSYAP